MKAISKTLLCQVVGGQAAAAPAAGGGHLTLTEFGTAVAGVGAGYGAQVAVGAAGSLEAMGAGAIAAGGAMAGGVFSAGVVGYGVGGFLYEHSETVQNASQGVIEYGMGFGEGLSNYYEGIGDHSCTYAPGMSNLDMPDYSYI